MGLTAKQQRFVEEYLIDLNATRAAKRAGYSARNADKIGAQLLGKTRVAEAVEAQRKKQSEKADIKIQDVIREYARLAFSNVSDFLTFDAAGVALKDSSSIPREILAAVSEVSDTKEGVKFKLHSKTSALDSLCKVLGFNFSDRSDSHASPGEIAKRLMDLLRMAGNHR